MCFLPFLHIYFFHYFLEEVHILGVVGDQGNNSGSIHVKPLAPPPSPRTGHQYCVKEQIHLSVQAMDPFDMLL